MDNFDLRKYLKENKLLKESLNQNEFEEVIDKYEEEVEEEVGSDDTDEIGRMVSERAEEELSSKYPNIEITYTPYNTGRNYSAFDKTQEEIVADYTV